MSKKTASILLIIVAIVGSIFTFYGSNLLFSDVANIGMGYKDNNFITSFPFIMLFCQFILAEIYLSRYIRRPQYVKRMTKRYLIIFICFSVVAIVFAILSGVCIYHSFVKPYPIPAYCLLMVIVNVIFIATAVYAYILVSKRMKDDTEKRKFNIFYDLYTFFTVLMVYFAFERFGGFLYSPFFLQWRLFYMLWPFLITLIVPMSMMVQSFLYIYKPYKEKPLIGLIYAIVNLVLGIGANVATIIIGYYDSRLVASVSPCMALERLDCSTVDIKLIVVVTAVVGLFTLQYAIRMYIKSVKAKKALETAENK